jgi:cell division protein FtsW
MKKLAAIIFLSSITLMLIGMVLVMSASSAFSEAKFDDSFHLFSSHMLKVIIGIVLMLAFAAFPYEYYKSLSKPAIFILAGVLVYVLFAGSNLKGAGRWVNLGFASFQPAEAAKLILIMHLAVLIERKGELIKEYKSGFLYMFIWVILISGLIIIQPNLSNGILLIAISVTMLYAGGARLKHLVVSSALSLLTAGAAVMAFSHSRGRILTFFKSVTEGGGVNFQVTQSVLSLGSGGIFGVGLGNSRQSKFFLPEAYGDFIFAILGEELGFLGSMLITVLFIAIFFCGIIIAKRTKDVFGQMMAFGITFTIVTYFMVNIGVTTGLLPTTGLPLPFISYGGTSLLFLCISIGILLNIALVQSKFELPAAEVINSKSEELRTAKA